MGSPFIEGLQAGQSSAMAKLQQKYLGQQITDAEQGRSIQQQNAQVAQDQMKWKKASAGSQAVINSDDPKGTVEALFPEIVQLHEQQSGPGSWETVTPEQIKMEAAKYRDHANMQLGQAPPAQQQTIGDINNPAKGVYQKDPTTGAIHQITAPQKPEESRFTPVNMTDGTVGRFNSKTGALESTGQKGGTRSAGIPPMSEDQMASRAKMIANYEMPPPSSYEMAKNPNAAALMEKVAEHNPDYTANEYASRSKAFKDFGSGKQGTQVRSFNVALAHLSSLEKAADALDNKDTQLFNKIGNEYARQTGNSAPTNFDGMKKLVTDEIVKAVVGAGGGVADREEASKTLSSASSPSQLIGMMGKYRELMAGQLGGLQQQYEQSTGRKDFERWLSPEAKGYLSQHHAQSQPPAMQPGQVFKHASGATVEIVQ